MWIDVGLTAKSIAPVPRHPRVSSLKFGKLTLLAPYTPSGVEGASKCCSTSGGVIGENVTGAAATIPGGEAGGVPGGVRGDLHGGVRGGVSGGVPGGVPGQVLGKSTGKVHADLSMAV